MQRSGRSPAPRNRATLRPRGYSRRAPTPLSSRGRTGRVQKPSTRARGNNRTLRGKRDADINHDARDVEAKAPFLGDEATTGDLHRKASIHACSDASLQFINRSSLQSDEDSNVITLNLMDYFLFSAENWLPELSYCKLHAACFFFASRITGKANTVEQIAESLGPDSAFVQLVGEPLAGDEESAAAIQYTISVTAVGVEDGYALLCERKEMFGHLLGQYRAELDNLPVPINNESEGALVENGENENWDTYDEEE